MSFFLFNVIIFRHCTNTYSDTMKIKDLCADERPREKMLEKGVINELKEDYEDLHGMSTLYINDHISFLLGEKTI